MPLSTLEIINLASCPLCNAVKGARCVVKSAALMESKEFGFIPMHRIYKDGPHFARSRAAEKTHNASRKDLQSVGQSVITKQKKTD